MYFRHLSVSLLLCFVMSGDVYKQRQYAVEEEYFSIWCYGVEGQTVNWYKEKEGKWTSIQEDGRITMNGIYLEFWPVALNDSGNYSCSHKNQDVHIKFTSSKRRSQKPILWSNGTHNIPARQFLDVLRRNKESCFNADHILDGRPHVVGGHYSFKCSDIPSVNVVNKTWYKNCVPLLTEDLKIDKLTIEDSGNYTCKMVISRAGKTSYQKQTRRLIVVQGPEDIAKPAIIGDDRVLVKTEIGKMEMINCSIFVGSPYNPSTITIYWLHEVNIIKTCNTSSDPSPCEIEAHSYHKDGKEYVLKQLWFKSIKEEDINASYTCVLLHDSVFKQQIFILIKEHNPDIPLPAFTTGIAMVILFFVLALLVAILCVVFRVDLVLLYRDITGKDETLGDGKTYDAFVSYLKDSMPICSEEQAFALDILPQTLEEQFGYKLCIFERDISPGGAVVDDVQSFIDRSRRLIIILSKNYISDKVMFELETGLHKALVEKTIKVILIEYTPIPDFSFLPKSLELLSSSQVVKWKREKSLPLNSRFWKKVCCAMPAKCSSKTHHLFFHSRTEHEHLVHPTTYPV